MKASELQEIVETYRNDYIYSDMNSSVNFGCDCGCGGDSYSSKEWDNMSRIADDAYKAFRNYCEQNNIEWDLE